MKKRKTHKEILEAVKQEVLDDKKREKLYKRAWFWMSTFVCLRDHNICFTCGKCGNQGGHFIHSSSLDFDERAIHCQCGQCNIWQSGERGIYHEKMVKKYGQKVVDELKRKAKTIFKPSIDELLKIKKRLMDKVKVLKA
jgi:hypothetical protein